MKRSDFYIEAVKTLPLGVALDHYYIQNPSFTPYANLYSERARRLVRAHDITHLVFGCATDQDGELRVQLWTRHAVEIKLSLFEKLQYFLELEALKLVLNLDLILFAIRHGQEVKKMNVEVALRAKEMTRKWRYFDEDSYMEKTVEEIRRDFNIQVI